MQKILSTAFSTLTTHNNNRNRRPRLAAGITSHNATQGTQTMSKKSHHKMQFGRSVATLTHNDDVDVVNRFESLSDAHKQLAYNLENNFVRGTDVGGYIHYGRKSDWIGTLEAFPSNPKIDGVDDLKSRHFSNWLIGAERFGEFSDKIAGKIKTPTNARRRVKFSEFDGGELDYDRLRSGQEYWRTSQRRKRKAPKTIALFIQVGQLSNRHWSDSIWRVAAGVATCVALEAAGYRVELHAVYVTRCQRSISGYTTTDVLIKRTSQPLDVNTAINTCSGWSHRTLFFGLACSYEKSQREIVGRCTRGMGATTTPRDKDLATLTNIENRFVFTDVHDAKSAIDQANLIIDQINNLG
jgi:hypothetical protein